MDWYDVEACLMLKMGYHPPLPAHVYRGPISTKGDKLFHPGFSIPFTDSCKGSLGGIENP